MGKKYRAVPVGAIAGALALVYDWWDWEITIYNVLFSVVTFLVVVALVTSITESIISNMEEEESIKPVITTSIGAVAAIFIFAFLVKSRM